MNSTQSPKHRVESPQSKNHSIFIRRSTCPQGDVSGFALPLLCAADVVIAVSDTSLRAGGRSPREEILLEKTFDCKMTDLKKVRIITRKKFVTKSSSILPSQILNSQWAYFHWFVISVACQLRVWNRTLAPAAILRSHLRLRAPRRCPAPQDPGLRHRSPPGPWPGCFLSSSVSSFTYRCANVYFLLSILFPKIKLCCVIWFFTTSFFWHLLPNDVLMKNIYLSVSYIRSNIF